jgi:hypothetical protein
VAGDLHLLANGSRLPKPGAAIIDKVRQYQEAIHEADEIVSETRPDVEVLEALKDAGVI